jgi:predicted AAA+ superfamily ATPase
MIITRLIQKKIEAKLNSGKVLLLLGARRTGKTFLFNPNYAIEKNPNA